MTTRKRHALIWVGSILAVGAIAPAVLADDEGGTTLFGGATDYDAKT